MIHQGHIFASWLAFCLAATFVVQTGSPIPHDSAVREESTRAVEHAIELVRRGKSEVDANQVLRFYQEAADEFESLRASGVRTARLEYNLAILYASLNEPGRAIASALRAERLAPRDESVAQVLAYARRVRDGRVGPISGETLVGGATILAAVRANAVWLIVAAWNLAWMAVLLTVQGRRRMRNLAIGIEVALLCGLAVAVTSESLIHDEAKPAVVVRNGVTARKGAGPDYDPATRLPPADGEEVRWLETRQDGVGNEWHRVTLRGGRIAWLPAETVEIVD